jgi:hypothetical protein
MINNILIIVWLSLFLKDVSMVNDKKHFERILKKTGKKIDV